MAACADCLQPLGGRASRHHCERRLNLCEPCARIFRTPEGLARHRRRLHDEGGARVPLAARKLFGCSACEATFARPSALTRHMRDAHGGAPKLACGTCGRRYAASRASELRAHERMHTHVLRCRHGEGYAVCGFIARSRDAMALHLRRAHAPTRATDAELIEIVVAPAAEAAAQRRYELAADAERLLAGEPADPSTRLNPAPDGAALIAADCLLNADN